VPGERIELPTNGLQNRCSTAELTRHYWVSCTRPTKLPPDCHRLFANLFSLCTKVGERRFHDLRSPGIGIRKEVAVDRKRDHWRAMTEPTADGQNVHSGGDQLAGVRVPQAVQGHTINLELGHCLSEFLGEPVRRAGLAIPPGKYVGHHHQHLSLGALYLELSSLDFAQT
jgi:hypothetical protein